MVIGIVIGMVFVLGMAMMPGMGMVLGMVLGMEMGMVFGVWWCKSMDSVQSFRQSSVFWSGGWHCMLCILPRSRMSILDTILAMFSL